MLFAVLQDELRQEIKRSTLVCTHTNATALQTLHLSNRLTNLVAQSEYALRIFVNYLACLSEHGRLLCPVEKRQPDLFLETPYSDAYRRLCPKHLVGSLRKALFL